MRNAHGFRKRWLVRTCSHGQYFLRGSPTYAHHSYSRSKDSQALSVVNSKFNGQDAYSTHDLFVPHPIKDGCWKLIGRSDDQITLSTGCKVRANATTQRGILIRPSDKSDSSRYSSPEKSNLVLTAIRIHLVPAPARCSGCNVRPRPMPYWSYRRAQGAISL